MGWAGNEVHAQGEVRRRSKAEREVTHLKDKAGIEGRMKAAGHVRAIQEGSQVQYMTVLGKRKAALAVSHVPVQQQCHRIVFPLF